MDTEALDPRNPPQVLVHFYRASVQHADVWRQRLDSTTNWAVITTAAVITFAFGSVTAPHFVVLLALLFDAFFLFMEARRYQAYNVWQRRIRVLHRALVVPALKRSDEVERELVATLLAGLARDLGHWLPTISIYGALGYRIRRSYALLLTLVMFTWQLKLYIHPDVAGSFAEFVGRARVGLIPGSAVLSVTLAFYVACVVLAVRAPTEQMEGWVEKPAPIARVMPQSKQPLGAETGEDMVESMLTETLDEPD